MKLSARVLFRVGKKLSLFALSSFLFALSVSPTYAQSYESNTNADVPENQHTKSQIMLIETSSAIICQIAGIDFIDPQKGCLGVDPKTQKIGYVSPQGETPQIGGILGMSASLMGTVYQPPASGTSYMAGVINDFGIVKKAYAQTSGFEALSPVLKLWEISRNICYALLVLVFIAIGVGIMLRVKIDPRTAMTIQNQVPRIIVAIILITFSYSIIGFMVDMMWLTTYVGINAVSNATGETICSDGSTEELTVGEGAYANLLNTPLAFMNDLIKHPEPDGTIFGNPSQCDLGIKYLSITVASTAGNFLTTIIQDLFGLDPNQPCGFLEFGCTVENGLANFIGWIGQMLMLLIVFIALLLVMFRLWWQLLKAYALIVFYTILGPFWIVLGLLPNSERNFNSWLRTVTAKLLSFPAAALMIVIARVVLDTYNYPGTALVDQSGYFTPPLVGNPNLGMLGPLLAFAILLIAPDVLNMLNDALKAPANKYIGPAITGGVAAGLAVAAPAKLLANRGFKYDQQGGAHGFLSVPVQNLARKSFKTGEIKHGVKPTGVRHITNRVGIGAAKVIHGAMGGKNIGGGGTPSTH